MAQDALPASLMARIEVLETRLAYQEDWLDALDRMVIDQNRQLERLTRLNALLQQRLSDQAPSTSMTPLLPLEEDERPPHY